MQTSYFDYLAIPAIIMAVIVGIGSIVMGSLILFGTFRESGLKEAFKESILYLLASVFVIYVGLWGTDIFITLLKRVFPNF